MLCTLDLACILSEAAFVIFSLLISNWLFVTARNSFYGDQFFSKLR